jgi:hypothetical protein
MKISTIACTALACATLSACNPYDPGRLKLTPDVSDKAIVLLNIDPRSGSGLTVVAFDETRQKFSNNPARGVYLEAVGPAPFTAEMVSPGTYAFKDLSRLDYWHACFHKDTRAFDVRPGEVLFLGTYDPFPDVRTIEREAAAKGEMQASLHSQHTYFDDIPPPAIAYPQGREKALADAQAFVAARMPNVKGPVHLAEYRPAHFENGKSFYGEKVCGDY